MSKLKVNVEVKQTFLSKFLVKLAMFLYFCNIVNTQLYLQIIDMAFLDIKSFKFRIGKGKWQRFKLNERW